VCSPIEDEATTPSNQHTEVGGQIVDLGGLTASSCTVGANSNANRISSPTDMEEDVDDDLLDYEPSPARASMEISVIYLSSIDCSLLEEEEASQLALGPQDAIFKKSKELGDHLKLLYIRGQLDDMPVAHMLVDGCATVNVMLIPPSRSLGRPMLSLSRQT
jgi:hypothetical protein